MTEKARRRFTMWIAVAIVGVLAVAGLVAWRFWPAGESDVAVPARVCDNALPRSDVKALLPARGKPFSEWHTGVFNPDEPYVKKVPGTCKVYGGGQSVTIKHGLYSGAGYTMQDVARDAHASGATEITLGEAKGFHNGDTTSLFAACPSEQSDGKTLVEVDVTYRKTTDQAVIRKMASLAADTLRLEARKLWACDGANDLPNGRPLIG
ncbi:hypothetical protein AQJ66_35275 [Streptomyces bungoensis]|uniref:DUF3558 domain-containing protein n=2 Tax=Streptomyces bungoensis TaxID=285568 RepID=A0A101SLH3_9ACTN|nr:hypothetical protein AQJ66_35275 [Streptomyces bungoensis]